jgi:hypothetical protein
MKFTIVVIALGSVLLTGCDEQLVKSTRADASDHSLAIVDGSVPSDGEKSKLLAAIRCSQNFQINTLLHRYQSSYRRSV